jgi:hypothetical protein
MARGKAPAPATEPELPPEEQTRFEEGFTVKSAIGALFIALFMLPGSMYLGLMAGQGVGDAAEWVTIVLFAEVARRSYAPLRRQEIYILFYIAVSLTAVVNLERGLGGGPFSLLVWNAYFIGSPAARPIHDQIPIWAIPTAESPAILHREMWHPDWWRPIFILVLTDLFGRLSWMGMGYALFRVTSDVEKLPFPMAPVAASGATALSEAGTESWRWSVFSTGTVLGLLFGVVYVAVPTITGTLFGHSLEILPIPFADYTPNIQNLLPAAIVGLSFSLGNVLMGFVLPFHIVLGAAVASVLGMIVINPILFHNGLLPSYKLGSDAFMTKLAVDMDFWLSIGIGVNISIAILGIMLVVKALREARLRRRERNYSLAPPSGRGDLPIFIAIGAWLVATTGMIVLCRILVPGFPIWILLFFGFVWSPMNSYISARMIGLTGRGIAFPYLKEASVVASGYRRVDIWYAPVPLADHGWAAQRFREVELTGTKFTSILKAEALMFPLIMLASFFFWSFFWNATAVPSGMFPYAQRFWPLHAQIQSVIQQINVPRPDGEVGWFAQAIKPLYIGYGTAGGLALYGLFSLFRLPLLFFYGFAGGLGLFPANTLPQLLGAWVGRRYMARRYGTENWMRYAPVLLAGFACGTGLIAMTSISLAMIAKAVARLPY